MTRLNQESSKKGGRDQKKLFLSSLLHRTPVVAGGLVCAAVLVGFLFYVQTGLFVEQPSLAVSRSQISAEAPQTNSSPEQPKKTVLDAQSSLEISPPEPAKPSGADADTPAVTCGQDAAKSAKRRYEHALSAEGDFHRQALQKIGKLSKMLSTLGMAKDQTKIETTRHNQAIDHIEEVYRQTLADAGC